MLPKRGIFITCEGGEGVGKSSFLQGLLKALKSKGIQLLLTREPGGCAVGEAIRSIFSHPPKNEALSPEAELFLVSAARVQHVTHTIQPQLNAGVWVLCDRFTDSTLVYQGVLGGLSRAFLDLVNEQASKCTLPEITFLLDCPVDISMSRIQKRGNAKQKETRFDQATQAHHAQIRDAYLRLAQEFPDRFIVLHADRPLADLVEEAVLKLEKRGILESELKKSNQ